MAHWTDDPKIHALMMHLGKTGKTGKPTRSAFVADQVSQIMVKIEPRIAEHRAVTKDIDALEATYAKLTDLIENKKRHAEGITIEFEQAKEDLLSQNPNADVQTFNKDLRQALNELEADYQKAMVDVEDVKQSLRVKLSTRRGLEDRMETYRKQVFKHIDQLIKARQQQQQQKSA